MPVANRKNLMLDRPTSHGGWPEGEYNYPIKDQIFDYLESMGLAEAILRVLISRLIMESSTCRKLDECIIAAGQTDNQHILAKTRDRTYRPDLKIMRELLDDGTEIVYMLDTRTGFLEGMNSHGIGILNSTLMVYEDENPLEHGTQNNYGNIIKQALSYSDIEKVLELLGKQGAGVEGHTFVGSPEDLYSIERTQWHDTIINRLDPASGFNVRTNHGHDHPNAGYTSDQKPEDYLSSKIRKATAETALSSCNDHTNIARSLLSKPYDSTSNYNTFRRTDYLRTTSQITMNLPALEFLFYVFPNECDFHGLEDTSPDEYEPVIGVSMHKWKEN